MTMRQSYAVKVAAMKEKDKSPEYHRENNKGQVPSLSCLSHPGSHQTVPLVVLERMLSHLIPSSTTVACPNLTVRSRGHALLPHVRERGVNAGQVERKWLFHGTSDDVVPKIVQQVPLDTRCPTHLIFVGISMR